MSIHLSFQSKTGSYQMECRNNIIICTFNGAMSVGMAQGYYEDLEIFAKRLSSKPWGYLAYAIDHQAAVPDAENILRDAYQMCIRYNCVSDAYCMNSAMAIAQLDKIRQQCNMLIAMEQCLFTGVDEALEALEKKLEALSKNPALSAR